MNAEELKKVIRGGETSTVQFKRTFRAAEDAANEMIAFSNSRGGLLIIGIDDKSGEIIGLSYQEIQKLGSLIAAAANDGVRPSIYPVVESVEVEGKIVMTVEIERGREAPYKNQKGEIYVKQGPDKRRVTDNLELLRLFYNSSSYQPDRVGVDGTSIEDLDKIRLDEFFKKYYHVSIAELDMPLERALHNLDIIDSKGRCTMAGLMFFGRVPRLKYEWFMIKAVWFYGDSIGETEYRDSRDFIGTVPTMFDKAMDFLDSVLHHVQGGQNFNSVGILEIPEIALREILQNALIHRSWLTPAPVRLLVFSDRVEIISPGSLPNNLTVDDIKLGNAYQRNQLAATLCAKTMDYRGLGSGIVRALRADADIEFHNEESGDQFRVILWRKRRNEYEDRLRDPGGEYRSPYNSYVPNPDNQLALTQINKSTSEKILFYLKDNPKMSTAQLAAKTGKSTSCIAKNLKLLKDSGKLQRIGPDKGGQWKVIAFS